MTFKTTSNGAAVSVLALLALGTSAFAADGKAFLKETAAAFAQTGPISADDVNAMVGKTTSCTAVTSGGDISNRSLYLVKEAPNLYKHFVNTSACGIVACSSYEEQEFRLNETGEVVAASPLKSNSYIQGAREDDTEIRFKRSADGSWVGKLFVTKKKYVFWGPKYEKVKGYIYCGTPSAPKTAAESAQPKSATLGEKADASPVASNDGSSIKQAGSADASGSGSGSIASGQVRAI